ncbi:uncharacterized protein PV09_00618 [Verruconis gallopava]|uniref:Uncharacterized protein n=1 Tax=Verruconis gallopava TaxID=253628 RepID=A0A0D2AQ79_9PEZI|nr:uncharacterized protein PV09_00618 [Verruconis gallopava]KIW08665.1 hypothetical protein PV09_00618 [Verruconis gallopava]
MPLLRPINLPAPLIVQSVTLVGFGIYTTFFRGPIYSTADGHYSLFVPANPSPRVADTLTLLGIVTTGLQGAYLISSYMPLEENQFVHASVPARLFLSACMLSVCLVHRPHMSSGGFRELLTLGLVDGAAAAALGFQLGRFDGMVKNAERWL